MMKRDNIILIGLMGTGKSTVGRCLAQQLGWRFTDTDVRIEERESRSIPELFAARGEDYFRKVESLVIEEALSGTECIISTGGGAVLAKPNREKMSQCGLVVALTASFGEIVSRVSKDQHRPLLLGNVEERVAGLMEDRKDAYRFADLTIDTTGLSPEEIAGVIAGFRQKLLNEQQGEGV